MNLLVTDKAPPSRPDVEKNILGTLIVDPVGIDTIKDILEPSAFYVGRHSEIYSTMLKMRESGIEIDMVTLPEYIVKNGYKSEYDIVDYIAELCQSIGSIKSLPEYVKIVNEKAIVRQIISKNTSIIQQCYDEDYKIENMITQMESYIVDIGANCDKAKVNRKRSGNIVKVDDLNERMFEYRKTGLSGIVSPCFTIEETFPVLSKHIKFAKGMLNIFTGYPGHGKSEMVDQIAVSMAQIHGWKWAIFSPENYPYERHIQKFVEKIVNKSFFKTNEHELLAALNFINNHFYWLEPDEENIKIDNLVSMNLEAKKKYDISSVIWDPWNEIEPDPKGHEKETDYIGRMLGKIRRHARRHDYMMNIVAHPAKPMIDPKTKKYPVARLSDINGSMNWYNKADNGFSIYRHFGPAGVQPVPNIDFHIQKIKFKIHGEVGVVQFNYDKESGRFNEHDTCQEELRF
jgi:hypothetical protein